MLSLADFTLFIHSQDGRKKKLSKHKFTLVKHVTLRTVPQPCAMMPKKAAFWQYEDGAVPLSTTKA